MILKRITIAAVFVLFALASVAPVRAEQSPMDRVKEGSERLIEELKKPEIQDPQRHAEAIAELRDVANDYIDFKLVTMYAVGRPWLKMSPKMQDDLTEALIDLLERTYLKRIPVYNDQKVDYKQEQIDGSKARVVTEIIDKDKKIVVEFRLKNVKGRWMIYDVVAEGVSLVANYRSQFSQILNEGTAEDLLKKIRERVKKLDQGEEDEAQTKS